MLPFSGTRAQYLQGGLCVIFTADGGEELLPLQGLLGRGVRPRAFQQRNQLGRQGGGRGDCLLYLSTPSSLGCRGLGPLFSKSNFGTHMFTGKLGYDTWRGVLLGVRNALATLRDGLPDGGEDFKRLEPTHRRSEWGSAAAVAAGPPGGRKGARGA